MPNPTRPAVPEEIDWRTLGELALAEAERELREESLGESQVERRIEGQEEQSEKGPDDA